MGIFDDGDISVNVPETEPVQQEVADNSEVGQNENGNDSQAPEVTGQAQAPVNEGQATEPRKFANQFDSEEKLNKSLIGITNLLGEKIDIQNMSVEEKESYYIDARKRLSQFGKRQRQETNDQTQQTQQTPDQITELKQKLEQLQNMQQINNQAPVDYQDDYSNMTPEEFNDLFLSNPKQVLDSYSALVMQQINQLLAPSLEMQRQQSEIQRLANMIIECRKEYSDFQELEPQIAEVFQEKPFLKQLGKEGLELAYELAKVQKLPLKALELLERESDDDLRKIETMKGASRLPSNTGSTNSQLNSRPLSEAEIFELQINGVGKGKGIFDD